MSFKKAHFTTASHRELVELLRNSVQERYQSIAFGKISISELAWQTRNLLELYVWILYCVASAKNAEDIYQEALRDMLPFHKRVSSILHAGHDLEAVSSQLIDQAKQDGWSESDARFTDVAVIASRVGYKQFSAFYALLSKFAHPTIGSLFLKDGCEVFRNQFETLASLFFEQSLESCDNFLGK